MRHYLDKLDNELSPIVGYGLVILCLIVAYLGIDSLKRHVDTLRSDLTVSANALKSLEQIQSEAIWEERLVQSRAARDVTMQAEWTGQTQGIIAAGLQQRLRAITRKAKLKSVRIRVEPEIDTLDGIDVLYFELRGTAENGDVVTDIIADIAADPRLIIVQDSNLSFQSRRPSQISLSGLIPIRLLTEQATQ